MLDGIKELPSGQNDDTNDGLEDILLKKATYRCVKPGYEADCKLCAHRKRDAENLYVCSVLGSPNPHYLACCHFQHKYGRKLSADRSGKKRTVYKVCAIKEMKLDGDKPLTPANTGYVVEHISSNYRRFLN